MRQKVLAKNLKYSFFRVDKEKIFNYLKMLDGILIIF